MTGDGWVRALGRILARERERERLLRAAVRFDVALGRTERFLAVAGGGPATTVGPDDAGKVEGRPAGHDG